MECRKNYGRAKTKTWYQKWFDLTRLHFSTNSLKWFFLLWYVFPFHWTFRCYFIETIKDIKKQRTLQIERWDKHIEKHPCNIDSMFFSIVDCSWFHCICAEFSRSFVCRCRLLFWFDTLNPLKCRIKIAKTAATSITEQNKNYQNKYILCI